MTPIQRHQIIGPEGDHVMGVAKVSRGGGDAEVVAGREVDAGHVQAGRPV